MIDEDEGWPVTKTIITGWCNVQPGHPEPLHRLCHEFYSSKGPVTDGKVVKYVALTYMCTCACHNEEPAPKADNGVRKVQRRRSPEPIPVRKVQRRSR